MRKARSECYPKPCRCLLAQNSSAVTIPTRIFSEHDNDFRAASPAVDYLVVFFFFFEGNLFARQL